MIALAMALAAGAGAAACVQPPPGLPATPRPSAGDARRSALTCEATPARVSLAGPAAHRRDISTTGRAVADRQLLGDVVRALPRARYRCSSSCRRARGRGLPGDRHRGRLPRQGARPTSTEMEIDYPILIGEQDGADAAAAFGVDASACRSPSSPTPGANRRGAPRRADRRPADVILGAIRRARYRRSPPADQAAIAQLETALRP